jgi:hypothetical protein
VGAVLQNRLADALHTQAVSRSSALPPNFRQQFVDAFNGVAKSGFQVGRGQSGGAQLPPGIPPAVGTQLQQLFHDVFVNAYVDAMRPTIAVAITFLFVASISCLFVVRRKRLAAVAPAAEEQLTAAS